MSPSTPPRPPQDQDEPNTARQLGMIFVFIYGGALLGLVIASVTTIIGNLLH